MLGCQLTSINYFKAQLIFSQCSRRSGDFFGYIIYIREKFLTLTKLQAKNRLIVVHRNKGPQRF